MPLLHHPVVGTLAGDGEAVKLPRQADREVADIDHLLDFAEALLEDFPALECHQSGQRLLGSAQLFSEEPDQLAAPGAGTTFQRGKPGRASRGIRTSPVQTRPISLPSIGE